MQEEVEKPAHSGRLCRRQIGRLSWNEERRSCRGTPPSPPLPPPREPRRSPAQDSSRTPNYGMVEYNFGSLPTRESAEALRSWDLTQPYAGHI